MTKNAYDTRRAEALKYFWNYSVTTDTQGLKNKFSNFKAVNNVQQSAEEAASHAVDRMLNGMPTHFIMSGSTGIGKTRLAYAMLNSLYRSTSYRVNAVFLNMPRVARMQSRIITEDDVKRQFMSIVAQLGKADLVILDDVGQEKQTDWGQLIINTTANERQGKSLIITSRSTDLSSAYTTQTRDRLLKGHDNVWHGVMGPQQQSSMPGLDKLMKLSPKERQKLEAGDRGKDGSSLYKL